nr:cyclin-dependent kinase F-4-like [Tanacetum cinerariifolium]
MEKYKCMEEVGRGTFGVVHKAIDKETGEVVAVKKLKTKYDSWEECMNFSEVKAIKKMKNHPNIVEVKEIIKHKDYLCMVFEYMECSLNQAMAQQEKPFSETVIRYLCFQILQARKVNAHPLYTDYITTHCYRAPEVILCSPVYDNKVDMWAMGGIMAELLTLKTLFPGESGAGVMHNICRVLGTLTETAWSEGLYLASNIKYQFPDFHGVKLSNILPSASPSLLNLISGLLSWDPCVRPVAIDALQHPFFDIFYYVSRPLCHEPETMDCSLILGPPGFRLPLQREFLKETRNLETRRTMRSLDVSGVTIAHGGVLPNINVVLLPKKTAAKESTPNSPSKAGKSPKKATA